MDLDKQIDNSLAEQKKAVYELLSDFANKRKEWYESKQKVNLHALMQKDIVMFAARGVSNAHDFVLESFRAIESTSEETVMGNLRQQICAKVSADTLDTGDMTTLRDGNLYVCELKSQANTVNSSSFPQELRELRDKCDSMQRYRRASKQKVIPAFCVMRNKKPIDEMRVYHANEKDFPNRDLEGFTYRYLAGAAFWQWLIGLDSVDDLIDDFSKINFHNVQQARKKCIARLIKEMDDALRKNGLGNSMNDVLKLRRYEFS